MSQAADNLSPTTVMHCVDGLLLEHCDRLNHRRRCELVHASRNCASVALMLEVIRNHDCGHSRSLRA